MSLLPSYAQTASAASTSSSSDTYAQEWGLDEETGELTGYVTSGNKAVRAWIYKALRTPRKRYPIYTWNYGSDLEGFIGQALTDEYLKTDVRLALEECLYINTDILSIEDYEAERSGDSLLLSFTVKTKYGDISILDYEVGGTTTRIQRLIISQLASVAAGETYFYLADGSLYLKATTDIESVADFEITDGSDLTATLAAAFDKMVDLAIDTSTGALEATYEA